MWIWNSLVGESGLRDHVDIMSDGVIRIPGWWPANFNGFGPGRWMISALATISVGCLFFAGWRFLHYLRGESADATDLIAAGIGLSLVLILWLAIFAVFRAKPAGGNVVLELDPTERRLRIEFGKRTEEFDLSASHRVSLRYPWFGRGHRILEARTKRMSRLFGWKTGVWWKIAIDERDEMFEQFREAIATIEFDRSM